MSQFLPITKSAFLKLTSFCTVPEIGESVTSFFCRQKKFFKGLVLTIALFFLMIGKIAAQGDVADWTDTDDVFSAVFNAQTGTIDIRVWPYQYVDFYHFQFITDAEINYYLTENNGTTSVHKIGSFHGSWDADGSLHMDYTNTNSNSYITNFTKDVPGKCIIKVNITNSTQNISKIEFKMFARNHYKQGNDRYPNFTAQRTITIPKMSPVRINDPLYSFLPNGNTRISYSKTSLNAVDNASSIYLFNNRQYRFGYLPIALSGQIDISNNSYEGIYHFEQQAYNNNLNVSSGTLNIPAFTFPTITEASYDTNTQSATLNWDIDPVSSGNKFINNRFKIEQSDNQNFNNATTIYADYDPTQSTYNIPIDKNLAPHLWFRVSRDYPGFNWEVAKITDINIQSTITALNRNTLSLALTHDSAVLNWGQRSSDWVPGATFIITRINKTLKTKTDIKLTKDDYIKGKYIDDQISICNEYTYTLQILPPVNSAFATPAIVAMPNSILPVQIGSIFGLNVSKGYFSDRTELSWSSQGNFDNFIVKRAVYGTTSFVQLALVAGSTSSDYQTDDSKGTPGVYYTYAIIGVVQCNNKPVYSKDTLYSVGFRSPTGNIYGRVTYENGQAVQNVGVRLESNSTGLLGKSIALDGSSNSYLQLDSLNTLFSDTAFTIETWIKPTDAAPKNQVIFSRAKQYELGFDNNGALYFSNGNNIVTAPYQNTNQSFIHITGIHTKDSLLIMMNDAVVAKIAAVTPNITNPGQKVFLGTNGKGNNFKGLLDEVRVWNIEKKSAIIARDYTRLLAGDEAGLVAYWRFDETITDQFYDLSHAGDDYNQNEGKMNAQSVSRSSIIPTADQLSLKGLTDNTGNYLVTGIPFTGNGVTYAITPILGTHQFDPTSVNRLISATSLSFTVDFKDKSSFPVSGTVYYKNSTIPVSGVQFKIDGQYAQQGDGTIIETDINGKFQISVPVGSHEVQSFKPGHVFVGGGRITDISGDKLNYQGPVSERELRDSTTIRFIGRVAGGAVEEAYPLGHSLSTNNLGNNAYITMALPTGTKYELYSGTVAHPNDTININHFLPSKITDSSKIRQSKVVYLKNSIVIYPDSVTGEFVADLIPEKFLATQVNVTGWGDLLDNKQVSLDFTNKFALTNSIYKYQDSTLTAQGFTYKNYIDTVNFNASSKFIKRVKPIVSIVQNDNAGVSLPYFGEKTYVSLSFTGKKDSINVIDLTKTAQDIYLYGNPIFNQNQAYSFLVKAFEEYPFYEKLLADGTGVIKKVNNQNLIYNVPTQDGQVSIFNKLKNGFVSIDTFSLNAMGQGIYPFVAGDPDLASKGLKDFSASVTFGPATTVNWQWFTKPKMQVYVMGGKLSGTDFVTAGPDKLIMVLRDPAGSKSYSYAEKGTTVTNSTVYSGSVDQEGDLDFVAKAGVELVTFTGIGVGVINSAVTATGIGFGVHHEEHYTYTNTKQNTTTLTSRFQTSDDPGFVGAPADVFVGYSTNITYGQSNNITIINRAELKATDITLFEPNVNSNFIIVQRGGINMGESFGTLFAFPQTHIENILIPNLLTIRNTALLPKTTTSISAQALANSSKKQVYVSKLDIGDANFGKSNNDIKAFGIIAGTGLFNDGKSYTIYFPATSAYRTDTVMMLNQYIENWIERMADNEKAKLQSTLLQNYSFHAGSPIEYSKQITLEETKEHAFNIIIGGSVSNSTDLKILGSGFNFSFKEAISTNQGGTFSNTNSESNTLGFYLGSNGSDDYFSVDVNEANDKSFVFNTKGGVSGCPYEGATLTKYYQPGSVLNQPTVRIEVPKLSVDKPVVNDIPETRKASYSIFLKNESEAKLPGTYLLTYADNDSIKGATISIDGTPIGGSGRTIVVPFGSSVEKVLTITKGPVAMNYDNIIIILKSGCQNDIADSILISAHFIPACSDIHIKTPADKWIVNTLTPVNTAKKRYLPITMDQFDVNNSLFDHIELQYKAAANSAWITAAKFYADTTKLNAADGDNYLITNAQAINYNLVVDDASFNDQDYNIQAVSVCKLGPANFITTESNIINGIKDTHPPRLFGSAQPANGVLGISDDIRLNFNKTIAAGLLTFTDFQVTGIRNGVLGDHSVSVRLDGTSNYVETEFNKNFTGKSITTEMWILPNTAANGTLFSQGTAIESMELALTSDNYLQVTMGNKKIKSDRPVAYKQGEWAHTALAYNATDKTVSAFYNFVEVIAAVSVDQYTGNGVYQFGRSISNQGNLFAGKIHRAAVWSKALTATTLQVNSLIQLSGAENNLLGYYPMDEGKGTVCQDKAHGSNATLNGTWSTPAGKAIKLAGQGYVKLNTGFSPVTSNMDYSMELWFKGDANQANAALASNGRGDNTDAGGSRDNFFLGFENKLLTFQNNGFKIQAPGNYLDNNWHQVALAVNRTSGIAQLYADGIMKVSFDAVNLGGVAAASTYIGVRAWNDTNAITNTVFDRYFTGSIDEFRIWNTYLNQTLINKNNNVRLQGDEIGLLDYYPFETYVSFQNNQQLIFSLKNLKMQTDPKVMVPDATVINASQTDEMAPIKDHGPVDNLKFDFVVNNDALIVNLQEAKQAIDKTIITIKVKNVKDLNGNELVSPISWTAYIDQNQLKWSDNLLNLSKAINAPLQFETYVVNSGGNIQNFRLSNLPGWLTADMPSGTVPPLGKQKIVFTVNQGLNIGTYDEVLFMTNDNNVTESLTLNLIVKGKKPTWSVNPADFSLNMNLFGKIRVKNLFSIDKEDLLAAFVNGTCVGLTNNTYNAASDLWFTYLTIYSDTIPNNNIVFRIWQASTGKVFEATPSIPVQFGKDSVKASIRNPIIFDGLDNVYQDITLNKGWNWTSFNVTNNSNTINGALVNGNWASGDVIKNQTINFDQYSASDGWIGQLPGVNNTSLFMLKTNNPQTLSISGRVVDVTKIAIPVKRNWNYISYLPQVNMSLKDGLAGYAAQNEEVIKSQDGFAMYDDRLGWIGNLTFLEPGKGYMLYRNQLKDTSFHYPQVKGFFRFATPENSIAAGNFNYTQFPETVATSFAQNMTVTATAGSSFNLQPGDMILAYSGGEVRARTRLIANPVLQVPTIFLNVSGDQELPVYFLVERNGLVIAQAQNVLTFGANTQVGTLAKPLLLNFNEEQGGTITTYPNPFTQKVFININVPVEGTTLHVIKLGVYNALGELITILPEALVKGGLYQASWNGKKTNGVICTPGMYFIRVTIDDAILTQKIIKN